MIPVKAACACTRCDSASVADRDGWTARMRFRQLSDGHEDGRILKRWQIAGRRLRGQQGARQDLVRELARPHARRARGGGGRGGRRAGLRGQASRPLHPHALDARGRRRRRDVDDVGPRVREGRLPYLDRAWRIPQGVRTTDPRRRGGPALLGFGHVLHRPSAQSQRPDRPHEHPHGGDVEGLVRRRRRPDARAEPPAHARRPGCEGLPRRDEDRVRRAEERRLCALQGMVRSVFLPATPEGAARHRRHLLRLS